LPSPEQLEYAELLVRKAVDFPRTHDLVYLLDLVVESGLEVPVQVADGRWLTPWAAGFRYEDPPPPALDRSAAFGVAGAAVAWSRELLAVEKR
jgi:hypothetical protein